MTVPQVRARFLGANLGFAEPKIPASVFFFVSNDIVFARIHSPVPTRRAETHVPATSPSRQTHPHHRRRHRPGQSHRATFPGTRGRTLHLRTPPGCSHLNRARTPRTHRRQNSFPSLRRPRRRRCRRDDRKHVGYRPARCAHEQCGRKFPRPHRRTFPRRVPIGVRHSPDGHSAHHHGLRAALARRESRRRRAQHHHPLHHHRLGLCCPIRRRKSGCTGTHPKSRRRVGRSWHPHERHRPRPHSNRRRLLDRKRVV